MRTCFARMLTRVSSCTSQSTRLSMKETLFATKSAEPAATSRVGALSRMRPAPSSGVPSSRGGTARLAKALSKVPSRDTRTGHAPRSSPGATIL